MTLPTSPATLDNLASMYEALTGPDIHLDGTMQRAMVEPLQTFLQLPPPWTGLVLTTSAYWDKAIAYHPRQGWLISGASELMNPNPPHNCVAGFSLWIGGGLKNEIFAYGFNLPTALCGALCRAWADTLRRAGRS